MALELAAGLVATEAERLLQAEALVRAYCGWHIAPSREETVTVHVFGGTYLPLPSLYVTEVSGVAEAGTALVLDDGYAWLTPSSTLTRYSWGWDADVEVTFTHGYEAAPPEVSAIVQAVAQRAVDNPGSRPRDQVGPFAESYSQVGFNQAPALVLLDAEKEALSRYRIPPRP